MIAKLPEELAIEMERNGDQPLTVENPHTNKLYVLMAIGQCTNASNVPIEAVKAGSWTEEMNARRFELIRKKLSQGLSLSETAELTRLQYDVDVFLHRVAPLPWEALQKLHDELLTKARANGSGE